MDVLQINYIVCATLMVAIAKDEITLTSHLRPVIAQAIVGLCNYLIAQELYNSTAWLTALPVYHFLRGTRPFSALQLDLKKLMSADKDLKTHLLKVKSPKHLGYEFLHMHGYCVVNSSILYQIHINTCIVTASNFQCDVLFVLT